MRETFVTIIISAATFVLGIIIGEPIKYYFNYHFLKANSLRSQKKTFTNLNTKMPDLLLEMHKDLLANPLSREFVIMSKKHIYNGVITAYYFEDHQNLKEKMDILMNHGLILNITNTNVDKYMLTEEFVDMLSKHLRNKVKTSLNND